MASSKLSVHKFALIRHRKVYIRHIKQTETNLQKKLSTVINEFPRLGGVHPFYADLLNLFHKKKSYKLALCRINTAHIHISRICKDYVKLLRYAGFLSRLKSLKLAALTRMHAVFNQISPDLAFFEQIRPHMSIDPNSSTVLIFGYPTVAKSCFMDKINGDAVVGHANYKNFKYQVIDTLGILNQPFEGQDRITTVLSGLKAAAVIFFLDISTSRQHTIAQQASLFYCIKSLVANKPLIVVCNEADLQTFDMLSDQDLKLLKEIKSAIALGGESNDTGVAHFAFVLVDECESLLRVDSKKVEDCLNMWQELRLPCNWKRHMQVKNELYGGFPGTSYLTDEQYELYNRRFMELVRSSEKQKDGDIPVGMYQWEWNILRAEPLKRGEKMTKPVITVELTEFLHKLNTAIEELDNWELEVRKMVDMH